METNNKSKNRKRNKRRKEKRKSKQGVNGFQNQVQEKEEEKQFEEYQKSKITPNPRPNNLLQKSLEIDIKRNSGSEFEEFQTPSTDYDLRDGGDRDENFSNDYDREWEELASFDITYIHDEGKTGKKIAKNGFISLKEESYKLCNGFIPKETEGISRKSLVTEKKKESHQNEIQLQSVICRNIERDGKVESIEEVYIVSENHDNDELLEQTQRNECTEINNRKEYFTNLEELKVTTENEVYVSCINKFLEELEYPEEENETIQLPISEIVPEICSEEKTYIIEIKTQEFLEDKIDNDDILNLICTQENVKEETLDYKYVTLDLVQQPLIRKYMTLKPTASIGSFKKSATSMTNVTSISDDNLPFHTEEEIKKEKSKSKSNRMKLYTKFMKKFRKEKSPEKEISNCETGNQTLSSQYDILVKDSEIESNQSLKSNNDFQLTSEIFPEKKIKKSKDDSSSNNKISIKFEGNDGIKTENDVTENKKINQPKSKREKPSLFNILLKKKPRNKSQRKEKIEESLLLENKKSIIAESTNIGNEETLKERREIEAQVLDQFNETIQSLMENEPEKRCEQTVVKSSQNEPCVTVFGNMRQDSTPFPHSKDGKDDHLFPDAVTATKIYGFIPGDVPFMDDAEVVEVDALLLHNGENKRCRIHHDRYVPIASMESLYFTDEPLENKTTKPTAVSLSAHKSKNVFMNMFRSKSRER